MGVDARGSVRHSLDTLLRSSANNTVMAIASRRALHPETGSEIPGSTGWF